MLRCQFRREYPWATALTWNLRNVLESELGKPVCDVRRDSHSPHYLANLAVLGKGGLRVSGKRGYGKGGGGVWGFRKEGFGGWAKGVLGVQGASRGSGKGVLGVQGRGF